MRHLCFSPARLADKRAKLIDKLLDSPGYSMHMFNWVGGILRVNDKINKKVEAYTFHDWLKDQLAANRPWDILVRDMLAADGRLAANGAVGFLAYDADMPLDGMSNLLTTFLGANVACAQCHDHPQAGWTQRDFYQMAAFFGASDYRGGDGKAVPKRLAKADIPGVPSGLALRVAGPNGFYMKDTGKQTLKFPEDYKYDDAKPGDKVSPRLIAWSESDRSSAAYAIVDQNPATLRDEFTKWLTHPDNPRFAATIANRLWKRAFGLAVQEPVTDLDDFAKASNPALLAHLSVVMKEVRFDLREFQRVLFNTQTYQRTASPTPDLEKGPYLFPGPLVRRMTAEQAWDSLLTVAVGPEIDQTQLRRGDEMRLLALPGDEMTAEALQVIAKRLSDAEASQSGSQSDGQRRKRDRGVAGQLDDYVGVQPKMREKLILARASELPQPSAPSHFLRLFGQSDRVLADDATTDGSVPQALMLMNGRVADLIGDLDCVAIIAAGKRRTPAEKVESLYLSFLARKPTAAERTAILNAGLDMPGVAWVLVNTREFLFIQ